jgi:hypothetical protein
LLGIRQKPVIRLSVVSTRNSERKILHMSSLKKLSTDDSEPIYEQNLYQQMIGSLMCLVTYTRSGLAFTVSSWLKERISQHHSMAKDTETERGKDSILSAAPKKLFLDGASNRLARTIALIRTCHWLCAPYLKRTRKNSDDEVSDRCWCCGQWRMSRTHVFLRFMRPN